MAFSTDFSSMRKALRGLAAICLVVGTAASLAACAHRNPQFATLHDQGLIPVSRENPYIGSNVYLAAEMEQSTYLYNFFKENGVPQAIEIVGDSEDSAELRMYYAGKNQVYHANPIRKREPDTTEWVIRGPYNLDKNYYRQVSQLSTQPGAQFEIWGRRETIGGTGAIAEQRVILPAFVPTPKPARRRETSKPASTEGPAISGVYSPGQTTLTLDQQALLESKENAERSPNGDLIHVVRSPTETLTVIANWYAGSQEHAKKIAEKNNLPVDAKLEPGTRVFIQAELVINPRMMK